MMNHYTSFFRLKENPFVLTPDPKYLYLGQKHREVLSHLLYGIKDDKGFMVVVGEVGTGKTTLCRAFINRLLKENIEVGLIYNPAVTDLELLQAINREFKIYSDFDSKGKLIDTLNEFLLKVNGEGRKVVLIIDEAQNLHPSVMEQLRLISNLETDTGKLIQIILVGQPELERILSKKEMRQLDQRIVVRGLLGPLKPKETMNYIRHRLNIASIDKDDAVSFSDGACRALHNLSGGTPRLINILADRSLLVAYAQGKKKIDKGVAKNAYRDLESSRYRPKSKPLALRWQTAAVFCVFVMSLTGWVYRDHITKNIWKQKKPEFSQPRANATSVVLSPQSTNRQMKDNLALNMTTTQKPTIKIEENPKDNPDQIKDRLFFSLERLSRDENWRLVLSSLFELWEETTTVSQGVTIGKLPADTSLNIWEVYGNLTLLKSLNYPAIVELKRPKHDIGVYAVLKKLMGDNVVMVGEKEEVMPLGMFNDLWYGHAYIVWKDFEGLPRVIYPGTSSLAVTWLQHNLKYLNLFDGQESGFYDSRTRTAIVRLQKEKNLYVDGIVGPQTKMTLYSLLGVYYRKPVLLSAPEKKG